jgi:hypothetical protein
MSLKQAQPDFVANSNNPYPQDSVLWKMWKAGFFGAGKGIVTQNNAYQQGQQARIDSGF